VVYLKLAAAALKHSDSSWVACVLSTYEDAFRVWKQSLATSLSFLCCSGVFTCIGHVLGVSVSKFSTVFVGT